MLVKFYNFYFKKFQKLLIIHKKYLLLNKSFGISRK